VLMWHIKESLFFFSAYSRRIRIVYNYLLEEMTREDFLTKAGVVREDIRELLI